MIVYVEGNLLTSPAKVLVNPVNTVGVMGKGLALEFKRRYPEMFRQYQTLCKTGEFTTGQLWLYQTPEKWILNFPTKQHWRAHSKLEYIEAGLQRFVATYEAQRITSVAFPQLGCGNGDLKWEDVQPLMAHYLQPLPIELYIYLFNVAASKIENQTGDYP